MTPEMQPCIRRPNRSFVWVVGAAVFAICAHRTACPCPTGHGFDQRHGHRSFRGRSQGCQDYCEGNQHRHNLQNDQLRHGILRFSVCANWHLRDDGGALGRLQDCDLLRCRRDCSLACWARTSACGGCRVRDVSVTADTLGLETESSEVDARLPREQVNDLPLAVTGSLRSISSLEFLVPGAVGPGTSSGGSGFQMTKINGGQTKERTTWWTASPPTAWKTARARLTSSPLRWKRFKSFTLTFQACRRNSAEPPVGWRTTRRAPEPTTYHGAVFDFYKNAALDGNNWFNNGYAGAQSHG